MLAMKSGCELCAAPLAHDGEALICSYECTYCPACAASLDACPNCGGELVARPRRTTGAVQVAARAPGRLVRRTKRALGRS